MLAKPKAMGLCLSPGFANPIGLEQKIEFGSSNEHFLGAL
jgi:hypothetical protein